MRLHTLELSQTVHAPLDAVFPYFDRPENLERITPPWMRMQTITPEPVPMHVGSVIDYVVSVRGIPMRWTSIITEYDPPHRFVDVQLRGPYSLWHHLHTFREHNGDTVIEDRVTYVMPFGPLGSIAHALFVRRDLESIFEYRQRVIDGMNFVEYAAI
jgi:ligand-binding SRPBCC domain-containing protein